MDMQEKIYMLCGADRSLAVNYTETGAVHVELRSERGVCICEATANPFACAIDVLFAAVVEKAFAALETQEGPW